MSDTLLAFDYGERFIGIAVGDLETGIAHPLGHYQALRDDERFSRAEALVREWRPSRLVVGLPLDTRGEPHPMTARAKRFAHQLSARARVPVDLVDERLTSASARETLRAAGRGGRRHKNETHALAAQVILQAWLDEARAARVNGRSA